MDDLFGHNETILKSQVELTDIDKEIFKNFDYKFDGKTQFTVPHFPKIQEDFSIGVIYGSSGSGKSSMLKQFGEEQELVWDFNKTIASHFDSVEDAIERLGAVGLNTVPTWAKPRNVLSSNL